jgi:hypothetical protein
MGFPLAQAHDTYAVRYMGVDDKGDPILRVLAPNLSRTDVVIEQAETDRLSVLSTTAPPAAFGRSGDERSRSAIRHKADARRGYGLASRYMC